MAMKKLSTRLAFIVPLLLLFSLSLYATEVSKEYHHEMVPVKGTTLTIINKYGDVVTETWDRNQIVIDVKVKVEHPSGERASRILEMISIEFTEAEGNLRAETIFNRDFSREFSSWRWRGSGQTFSISYKVSMPAWISLDLTNMYGKTLIDELSGHVRVNVKYGDLAIGRLTRGESRPLNSINIAYGKLNVDELGWAEINARYANAITIGKARALLIDSRYSKISVSELSSLVADCRYDGYNIGKANNIVVTGGYTDFRFGKVNMKLEADTRYGNLTVDQIPAQFEDVSLKSSYSHVRLAIARDACYRLDARSSYGSINMSDSQFDAERRIIGSNSSELSGRVGSCSSPVSRVSIRASYGSVRLN